MPTFALNTPVRIRPDAAFPYAAIRDAFERADWHGVVFAGEYKGFIGVRVRDSVTEWEFFRLEELILDTEAQ